MSIVRNVFSWISGCYSWCRSVLETMMFGIVEDFFTDDSDDDSYSDTDNADNADTQTIQITIHTGKGKGKAHTYHEIFDYDPDYDDSFTYHCMGKAGWQSRLGVWAGPGPGARGPRGVPGGPRGSGAVRGGRQTPPGAQKPQSKPKKPPKLEKSKIWKNLSPSPLHWW